MVHRFEYGYDVYISTKGEGDARELISSGVAEKELSHKVGRKVTLVRLSQTHSSIVRVVGGQEDRELEAGLADGDGLVSRSRDLALAVLVADCAPVVMSSPEGVFSAVHAGWQGVVKGVLPEAVRAMRLAGATQIRAYVGPSIRPECYEFKGPELHRLARDLGSTVEARTSWGTVSLDLQESVRLSLSRAGVDASEFSGHCTACESEYFSHRARRSPERHLMAIVPIGG